MDSLTSLQTKLRPDGILVLTMNREAQYNAMTISMVEELESALTQARANADVRAILVTGAGEKAFVAGADIKEFQQLTPAESRAFAERGQRVLQQLEDMPVPVLAAVNGFALGGGCELALACHLRVASDHAQIGLPEVKLGIIPGYGGTQRLTRLVGKGRALELMLTGNPISAAEAWRMGLVNHIVPPADLMPKSLELLGYMLQRAPKALAGVLEAAAAAYQGVTEGYAAEANAFVSCCHTDDFREGVVAFVAKRAPIFSGK
ncbi:enoyl-CoA hydratase-related protein [Hymenobacter sp. H14-R3]|uniref:enoyl-CoA hydratase/isomerase family protein n=1 Tax=Hymenobacter sp. H14-R3 TaxID=3046308 RepID=UPI0024B8DF8F|nr:enoyl-CoA hydratase-related protein [Hymenobacter sp. H14-R3]MDJ0364553.1 enoyl-CoA hydratase-related protein [Hymenobacter sp. H14-R3]